MLIRLVTMSFEPEKVPLFLAWFQEHKQLIRNAPGCLNLWLVKNQHNDSVYSTISHWESEYFLNLYRSSPLFEKVWTKTKTFFADKPMAKSFELVEHIQ